MALRQRPVQTPGEDQNSQPAITKRRARTGPRPWTYERYCAIPDDGYRYEVIWGELHVVPGPSEPHQFTANMLSHFLVGHVWANDLGRVYTAPFDVILFMGATVQPDLLYVRKERLNIVTKANVNGSPDLVIEVLSPSTAALDRGKKADSYAAAGVPHYWIFGPEAHTLEAYELREGAYALVQRLTESDTFESALFPGLSIRLADLWS